MMPVEIDEPLMTEIARMTGGRYFRATDTQSLRHVFDEINRLEKETVEQVVYRRFDEAYPVPPAPGPGALGVLSGLSATPPGCGSRSASTRPTCSHSPRPFAGRAGSRPPARARPRVV